MKPIIFTVLFVAALLSSIILFEIPIMNLVLLVVAVVVMVYFIPQDVDEERA